MSLIKSELMEVIEKIDEIFGDGYAKKNPELVGCVFQAQIQGQAMCESADLLHFAINSLANAVSTNAQ